MLFYETWPEARYQRPLQSLCFSGRSEKQDGRPGLWLAETFSTSPLNGIQQNLIGNNKFMFFGSIGGTRWPPGLWFAETFSTSPPWPLNKIQRNLTGSKISMSSTNFVLFGPIKKRPPWPLIGWDIFDSSSVTAEQNSTKLDRKQNLNVLYQVRVILRNLTGSKISTSSTKFVFFGPIGKTRWPPRTLIGWDIFDFSSERNSTKLDRK